MFFIPTSVEVTAQQVCDQIIAAFEGGSNHWIHEVRPVELATGVPHNPWYGHYSVFGGDFLIIILAVEDDTQWQLKPDNVRQGLTLMAEKYPDHFKDLIEDNGDAATADVFLQLCLFEEVVYG